jgi:hypothetical protein
MRQGQRPGVPIVRLLLQVFGILWYVLWMGELEAAAAHDLIDLIDEHE